MPSNAPPPPLDDFVECLERLNADLARLRGILDDDVAERNARRRNYAIALLFGLLIVVGVVAAAFGSVCVAGGLPGF